MGYPGYLYLVGRSTANGDWAKVGIAARLERVKDHTGWNMIVRTFEEEWVLSDPRSVEQAVLARFEDRGTSKEVCGRCGALKPPIGRGGHDGLTEIRHLDCHPGLVEFFRTTWQEADRIQRSDLGFQHIDQKLLCPPGFSSVGDPWRLIPRMSPSNYMNYRLVVSSVRNQGAEDVIAQLNTCWETGVPDLWAAMRARFADHIFGASGKGGRGAKGVSGCPGGIPDVREKLFRMSKVSNVNIVFLWVKELERLYAWTRK